MAEIGLGLRPDLTGCGLGESFLRACLHFASEVLGARSYTLAVAACNRRAITVYERAGFQEVDRFEHRAIHKLAGVTTPRPSVLGSGRRPGPGFVVVSC